MRLLKSDRFFLIVIVFISFSLRTFDLTGESIWRDEGYALQTAKLSPIEIVYTSVNSIIPLHYLLLHYEIQLFGDTIFSIRFLSVVVGVLATVMIYKLGILMFNREIGIISAVISALSSFHLYYSQEARMYSLMVLLTLLAFYYFIKLLKKNTLTANIFYLLFSSLLMYTHTHALFIFAAQNIYVGFLYFFSSQSTKPHIRKWILVQSVLIILLIPWLFALANQLLTLESDIRLVGPTAWLPAPTVMSIARTIGRYAGSIALLILFLILVSLALFKAFFQKKTFLKLLRNRTWNGKFSEPSNKVLLLLTWLLLPIALPFIVSHLIAPIYLTRYTIGASSAFYLLVAKGVSDVNNRFGKLITMTLLIILAFNSIGQYYADVNKAPWKDVVVFVDANAQSGDVLLFNSSRQQALFQLYSSRTDLIYEVFPTDSCCIDQENIGILKAAIGGYGRVWLLRNSPDDLTLIEETLNPSHKFSKFGPYTAKYDNGIDVYLLENYEINQTPKP